METRANHLLIGLATVVTLVAMMAFALWIAAFDFTRGYAAYVIVFEGPVRGLARGGEVRFQGIKVGEVADLRIDPDDAGKVLARVRIEADTPVRTSSIGQLEPIGLTGVNLIQLTSGRGSDPLARAGLGQPTPRIRGEASEIDQILGQGGDIAERASLALLSIQDLLSPSNVERFSRILADVEAVSEAAADNRRIIADADRALIEAARAAKSLAEAGAAVAALSRTSNETLLASREDLGETLANLRRASAASEAALVQIEAAAEIAAEQSLPDFAAAVQDIRRIANALDGLTAQIERNPSLFLSGSERPTVEVRP